MSFKLNSNSTQAQNLSTNGVANKCLNRFFIAARLRSVSM